MGRQLVAPYWPALTEAEVERVLDQYQVAQIGRGAVEVPWRSPRPTSAAALAHRCGTTVFLKRHHIAVRTPAQLGTEHAFARYLRSNGQPVPAVMSTISGGTVVQEGDLVYEVHAVVEGADIYRDALSWSGFASTGHALSAGQALAHFHLAAHGFTLEERPAGPLVNSVAIITNPDPWAALRCLCAERPGLAGALARRDLEGDFARTVAPLLANVASVLADLRPCWGHGDWHASNLAWDGMGPRLGVSGVFDLGLANRTFAVHDIALAIERNCIDWLDLAGLGHPTVDLAAVDGLVEGYVQVRPLEPAEVPALATVLPVCHVEHALSEVEYFFDVVGSAEETELAYDNYLLGHLRWFSTSEGQALLGHLKATLPSLL